MKRILEQPLLEHGVRGVANALAEVIQKYADEGKTLLYDPVNLRGYEPVDDSDLANAAAIFRGDLW